MNVVPVLNTNTEKADRAAVGVSLPEGFTEEVA